MIPPYADDHVIHEHLHSSPFASAPGHPQHQQKTKVKKAAKTLHEKKTSSSKAKERIVHVCPLPLCFVLHYPLFFLSLFEGCVGLTVGA
ncbi:hypothetical protein TRSC58_07645 [Trypanosoma rangeli SC58]|uniref:Uncharacterized protein n=1 Tax=Trypanosoma rangeli SC58 TaxID=429131 RepID=A0A061ISG6_TRYRA|nr:hypothetical protein TRSC58_07645 [Trypanosoma rangeli SC58]